MATGSIDISGLMSKIDGLVQMIDQRGTELSVELSNTRNEMRWLTGAVNAATSATTGGNGNGASAGIDQAKLFQKIDELIRGVNGGRQDMRATQAEIGRVRDDWKNFLKTKPDKKAKVDEFKKKSAADKNILIREGIVNPKKVASSLSTKELKETWRELGNSARKELLKGLSTSKAKAMWKETEDADRGALFEEFRKKTDSSGNPIVTAADLGEEGEHERRRAAYEERKARRKRQNEKRQFSADEASSQTFGWKRAERKATSLSNAGTTMEMAGTAMSAVKGLGKFGSAVATAGKMLSRFSGYIGLALAALDLIGDIIGSYKKYSAEMMEFQRKDEQLQYENQKKLAELSTESAVEAINYNADLNLRAMDVQTANALEAARINNQFATQAVETSMGAMTKGINQSAYDAAAYAIDNATDFEKLKVAKSAREQSQEQFKTKRTAETLAAQSELSAQAREESVNYQTERAMNELLMHQKQNQSIGNSAWSIVRSGDNDTGGTATNPVTGSNYQMQSRSSSGTAALSLARNVFMPGLTEGVQAVNRKELELQNQRERFEANWNTTRTQLANKENLARITAETSLQEKRIEYEKQFQSERLEAAKNIEKQYLKLAQTVEGIFDKVDAATNNIAMNLGITDRESLSAYQKAYLDMVKNTFTKWGKSIEEGAALQKQYIEATGRNTNLSEHDYGQLFGLGHLVGSDQLAAQYASNMELFNHSAEESVDLLDKALQNVTRMGLNGRKYTRDIVNNLKLVSKYNFKGGTKGFMDMAAWAQKVRFNVGSLEGILEKVKDGGLEGVIQQSAQFQVLGGNAAIYSDPLGMLYDTWEDPANMAKRMQSMLKGYGTYDEKTGETKFNGLESMLLAQIAKVQGRSEEEVRQGVIDMNKRQRTDKELNANENFNDEQKALIGSAAHLVDGMWKVTMRDGKTTKDVKDLTQADIDQIMPKQHSERMESYMQQVLEHVKGIKGEELREQYDQVYRNFDTFVEEYRKRIEVAATNYENSATDFAAHVKEGAEKATSSFQLFSESAAQARADFSDEIALISNGAKNIAGVLEQTAEILRSANEEIQYRVTNPSNLYGTGRHFRNLPTEEELRHERTMNRAYAAADMQAAYGAALERGEGYIVGESIHNNVMHQFGVPPIPYQNREIPTVDLDAVLQQQINTPRHNDGVVYGEGSPILTQSKRVTSINDGTVVRSNPNDIALFAKDGGPFDTLFNGVFSRIDDTYNAITGDSVTQSLSEHISNRISSLYGTSSVSSVVGGDAQFRKYIAEGNRFGSGFVGVYDRPISPDFNSRRNTVMPDSDAMDMKFSAFEPPMQRGNAFATSEGVTGNGGNSGSGTATTHNVNINLTGDLRLSSGGQSIDLMVELRNNPILMRQLTEAIITQVNNNLNGGKNELFGGGRYAGFTS